MKKDRIILIIMVFCVVATLFNGCASTPAESVGTETTSPPEETSATPAEDISVTSAEDINETGILNLTINTLDICQPPWNDLQSMYTFMVFDPLYSFNENGELIPKLASNVDISEDGKTYTYTIVENAKWHDGEPFTADDVAFSISGVVADPKSNFSMTLKNIEGFTDVKEGTTTSLTGVTVEGNKVIVKLTKPSSEYYKGMAMLMMLPEHIFGSMAPEEWQADSEFWIAPIGTGMYKVEEFKSGDYLKLIRNDEYFRTPAKIKNVLLKCFTMDSMDAAVAAMIAGDLDYVWGNAFNDISTAENIVSQNNDAKMIMMPSTYTRFFITNLSGCSDNQQHPGMQDSRVRQALNLLLDKEAIASFYGEQAVPLTTYITSENPMYNNDIAPFERDVEKAVELLDAADFDYNQPIRVGYYYADQTTIDIMELIKQNYAEAGVGCETELLSGDVGALLYDVKNFDMYYAGQFKTDAVQLMNPNSVGGGEDILLVNEDYRLEKFNTLFDAYNATIDPVEAKRIADELQIVSAQECFTFPVYGLNKILIYNTANLELPEEIFTIDNESTRDYRLEDWSLKG